MAMGAAGMLLCWGKLKQSFACWQGASGLCCRTVALLEGFHADAPGMVADMEGPCFMHRLAGVQPSAKHVWPLVSQIFPASPSPVQMLLHCLLM